MSLDLSLSIGPRMGLSFASGGGGVALPRYPNYPKSTAWQLRSTADLFSNPGGVVDFSGSPGVSDSPTGGGVTVTFTTTLKRIYSNVLGSPIDMSNGNIIGWLRAAASMANLSTLFLRLYSSGTPASPPANYVQVDHGYILNLAYRTGGWQKYGKRTSRLSVVGTGANLAAITFVEIAGQMSAGTLDISFSDVFFQPNPRTKAAVIFTGDDASPTIYSSLYTNKLHANGYPGPMFNGGAMSSAQGFDQAGRITTAQADEMIAGGAQFMSQAWSTESVPADFAVEYAGMMAAAAAKGDGWKRGSVDGSFYSSVSPSNEAARRAMIAQGIRTIRRFDNGNPSNPPLWEGELYPFRDEHNLHALSVAAPGGTGANIPVYIGYELAQAITNKGVLILAGHNDWADANVLTAVDNIMAEAALGNIEIHTMESLLAADLALYGPAPPRY